MLSQTRIDDFRGTDSQYIEFLESIVHDLTTTVLNTCQTCAAPITPSIHSPPTPPRQNVHHEATNNSDDIRNCCGARFVPYRPELPSAGKPPKKKQRTKPLRWQRDVDEMLRDIPNAKDWASKRKTVGLSSSVDIFAAFDLIVGGAKSSSVGTTNLLEIHSKSSATLLQLLTNFAQATAALEVDKNFTVQMFRFRWLVFVSICCVLLHHGVEKDLVDRAMHICISRSEAKNLDYLRRGSSWVHRMVRALSSKGLGHRASELFVLSGRSLSKYGCFANAGDRGFCYFLEHVSTTGYDSAKFEMQAHLPFWIPFFVKVIVGESYSLSNICTALGYDADFLADKLPLFVENYRRRWIPPLGAPTSNNIVDCETCDVAREGNVSVASSNAIAALLAAAQHSDSGTGSMPSIQTSSLGNSDSGGGMTTGMRMALNADTLHSTDTNRLPLDAGMNSANTSLELESTFYSPRWETIDVLNGGLGFYEGQYKGLILGSE